MFLVPLQPGYAFSGGHAALKQRIDQVAMLQLLANTAVELPRLAVNGNLQTSSVASAITDADADAANAMDVDGTARAGQDEDEDQQAKVAAADALQSLVCAPQRLVSLKEVGAKVAAAHRKNGATAGSAATSMTSAGIGAESQANGSGNQASSKKEALLRKMWSFDAAAKKEVSVQ